MAQRILLGAFDGTYVLRASRPGFDVTDIGLMPEQLSFDSRWQEAGNIIATGTFVISGNTGTFTLPLTGVQYNRPLPIWLMSGGNQDQSTWYNIVNVSYANWAVSMTVGKYIYSTQPQLDWEGVRFGASNGNSNNLPSNTINRYYVCRNIYQ